MSSITDICKQLQGNYDSSVSVLSFLGIGLEAAELLVARGVAAVGLDTGDYYITMTTTTIIKTFLYIICFLLPVDPE